MTAEDSPVRVGIVGLGVMGRTHGQNIEALGHDVAACADIDEQRRHEYADTYDADAYADYTEMYEADIDAVVITTPNSLHAEMAIAALEAGHHVLLEKPLANTLENARRIRDAAEASGGCCMVGFTKRFGGTGQRLKTLANEGYFGDLTHGNAWYVRRDGVPADDRTWFTNPEMSGGGALVDIGVHVIDLALYVMDFPTVTEVSAHTFNESSDLPIEDSASGFVRFEDGSTLSVEASWAANTEPTNGVSVRGTGGGARTDLGGLVAYDHDGDDGRELDIDDVPAHKREIEVFLDGVAADRPPAHCTVDEAFQVQRVLDAFYRSSEAGRAVDL